MATEIVTDTTLHQFHRTLVLNNKPSGSNTNQKTSLVLKTRDQTQYVYTIQTNPISQTNHLEHPVTQQKNITQWTRIIKDNDKPDYSSGRQTATHTQQSRILFFSHIRDIRHTITNLLHQKGSNCFKKKKTHQREREWGRRVHQHEAPTPAGSIKNQLPPKKKEGERAEIRQLRIEE